MNKESKMVDKLFKINKQMKDKVNKKNETKYLIIKCDELGDQWECDAYRTPLGITNDISLWKDLRGYDIYKIKSNGKLEMVKDYEEGDLHIATSSRKTRYIVNEDDSYVCDLTKEMKILLKKD